MRKFLRRKPKMKWVFKKILLQNRRAFTLIEVTVALVILGMITATVLVVVNRAIDTVVLWQTKMQTFDIARENMEKILAQSSVSDMVEYGIDEKNPDITWEKTIESFYEPITSRMWMRAVCTAQFVDSQGEEQKIELTHWLTSLSKQQILQILEQKLREERYRMSIAKNSDEQANEQQQQQEQQQTQQEPQSSEAEAWKEIEKVIGPPPAGYEHWGQVPEEQFLKAVKAGSSGDKGNQITK
jgi:prepilin-type N-terminal cleavage/methylation domain-containing protein